MYRKNFQDEKMISGNSFPIFLLFQHFRSSFPNKIRGQAGNQAGNHQKMRGGNVLILRIKKNRSSFLHLH